ncbi:MAG: hypothetical protein PUE08_00860 [Eubacteriales bacterium]|nr:hypothetical protein [Eubacteriales bacterium]
MSFDNDFFDDYMYEDATGGFDEEDRLSGRNYDPELFFDDDGDCNYDDIADYDDDDDDGVKAFPLFSLSVAAAMIMKISPLSKLSSERNIITPTTILLSGNLSVKIILKLN